MHPIIEQHRNEIIALCGAFGVEKLEVFGSVVTEEFDEARSDVDFIVHYRDDFDLGPWLQFHFELKARLADLLGRPVDLIMATNHRNPFIRQSINATRQVLYAA
jgi:predicted nucleotidyltransferase